MFVCEKTEGCIRTINAESKCIKICSRRSWTDDKNDSAHVPKERAHAFSSFSIYINALHFLNVFPFLLVPNTSPTVTSLFYCITHAQFTPTLDWSRCVWDDTMFMPLCRWIYISCWMAETDFTNILVAPVCLSILLNLVFLCNIVRVLLMKLKSPAGSQGANAPSRNILQAFRWVQRIHATVCSKFYFQIKLKFRCGSTSPKINFHVQWTQIHWPKLKFLTIFFCSFLRSHCHRATLLLVPLLGMQYILTPFKPAARHDWEYVYEIVSAFTASFQVNVTKTIEIFRACSSSRFIRINCSFT